MPTQYILHGSVVTHLRCGGIFDDFILLMNPQLLSEFKLKLKFVFHTKKKVFLNVRYFSRDKIQTLSWQKNFENGMTF